jgi:HK97 family phage prohead protease
MSESYKTKIEKKEFRTYAFECKALQDENEEYFYFGGYLSTYGNVDRYDDVMVAGCFDESLKSLKPKLLWQHEWNSVIGIFTDIKSDEKGLFVKGKLPKSDDLVRGRVIPQMQVESVKSMSIGFWAQEYEYDDDGIRRITKCMLYEGSLVSQPVNDEAAVTDMKALDIEEVEKIKTRRDFEKALRDSGAFSRKSAAYLASRFVEKPSDSVDEKSMDTFVKELNDLTNTIKAVR